MTLLKEIWESPRSKENLTSQVSLKRVIAQGDLVYRQYSLLPAPKHLYANIKFMLEHQTTDETSTLTFKSLCISPRP